MRQRIKITGIGMARDEDVNPLVLHIEWVEGDSPTLRLDLLDKLVREASDDYREAVMEWFDSGHAAPFSIANGDEIEVWEVLDLPRS